MILILTLAVRMTLGAVFVYAGFRKFVSLRAFTDAVRGFELAPPSWTVTLAGLVPLFECIGGSGLLLLSGTAIPVAATLLGGLLLVFSLALAIAWWRQQIVVCNCFGSAGEETSTPTAYLPSLARNMLLLASAVMIVLEPPAASHFVPAAITTSPIYRQGALLALAACMGWLGIRRAIRRITLDNPSSITTSSRGNG